MFTGPVSESPMRGTCDPVLSAGGRNHDDLVLVQESTATPTDEAVFTPMGRRNKRRITQEDVLQLQHKALIAKNENLSLKKRKLELEIILLENKVREAVVLPTEN